MVALIACVAAALGVAGVRVYSLSAQQTRNQQLIAELEREDIDLRYRIERLRGELRLVNAFKAFIGNQIPQEQLYLLAYLVYHNSQQFGYDPLLVLAVIRVESYFDPSARGVYRSGRLSGALGLMQLKFATAQLVAAELGIPLEHEADLFKPEINIPLGIGYLAKQIRFFRSLKLGILAYNQGPGTILNTIRHNQPLSTHYYHKVLKAYYRSRRQRQPGSLRGQIEIADDFDELPADVAAAFGIPDDDS